MAVGAWYAFRLATRPAMDGACESQARDTCATASKRVHLTCTICAIMHMMVVVQACRCLRTGYAHLDMHSADALCRPTLLRMLGMLSTAYVADLVATYGMGVVPYSRCDPLPATGGKDVLAHHLPIVCGILPLCLPFALGLEMDAAVHLLATDPVGMWRLVLLPFGWLCLSSLNEACMCMQRVDLPAGLWNTQCMYVLEMGYKCLIFTLFALASLCYSAMLAARMLHFCANRTAAERVVCLVSSPLMLSILVLITFIVTMYPRMARRAFSKLRRVLKGCDARPPGAPLRDTRVHCD